MDTMHDAQGGSRILFSRIQAILFILSLLLILAGCAGPKPPPVVERVPEKLQPHAEIACIDGNLLEVKDSRDPTIRLIVDAECWLYPLHERELTRRNQNQVISWAKGKHVFIALFDRTDFSIIPLDTFDFELAAETRVTSTWYDDSLLCAGYATFDVNGDLRKHFIRIFDLRQPEMEILFGKTAVFAESWISPKLLLVSDKDNYYVVERFTGKVKKKYARNSFARQAVADRCSTMIAVKKKSNDLVVLNLLTGKTQVLFSGKSAPTLEEGGSRDWVAVTFRDGEIKNSWVRHLAFYRPAADATVWVPVRPADCACQDSGQQVVTVQHRAGRMSPNNRAYIYARDRIVYAAKNNLSQASSQLVLQEIGDDSSTVISTIATQNAIPVARSFEDGITLGLLNLRNYAAKCETISWIDDQYILRQDRDAATVFDRTRDNSFVFEGNVGSVLAVKYYPEIAYHHDN